MLGKQEKPNWGENDEPYILEWKFWDFPNDKETWEYFEAKSDKDAQKKPLKS